MGKREISVYILLFLLGFMLGTYKVAPYYMNREVCLGDGYVRLNYADIYDVAPDEKLFVHFSRDGESEYMEKEYPKVFPLVNGEEIYYPLDEELECERITIYAMRGSFMAEKLQVYAVEKSDEERSEENAADKVYCNTESPCFVIGEETRALSDQLWKCSGKQEEEYITAVYKYLCEMEYDRELLSSETREPWIEYSTRMELDDVLKKNKGICREKANLMAALLRLKEIPCKVVAGMTAEEDISGHAWNEVYINGKWISFDATNSLNGNIENEREIVDDFVEYWCY